MLQVSELFIYPVKSLGGVSVSAAPVTERGLQYDRRWLLVDRDNRFMTQRQWPELALFQIFITKEGLDVKHKQNGSSFTIPFKPRTNDRIVVQIWRDTCVAQLVDPD